MGSTVCKECVSALYTEFSPDIIKLEGTLVWTPLLAAAYNGHTKCLEKLLSKPHERRRDELAKAVLLAVMKGHYQCTSSLIVAGADVNVYNTHYCSEYHSDHTESSSNSPTGQYSQNHAECMNLIIQAGLDVNSPGIYTDGRSLPLENAIGNRHTYCVKHLVQAKADMNGPSCFTESILNTAVLFNHAEVIDLLVEAGAEVNSIRNGESALGVAIEYNHKHCMKKLIRAGADVNIQTESGTTFLMKVLVDFCDRKIPLAATLLNAGADVSKVDNNGRNVVHHAAEKVAYPVIQILLEEGIDVNKVDRYGYTALMLAAGYDLTYKGEKLTTLKMMFMGTLKLLLKEGAFINKVDGKKKSNALEHFLMTNGTKLIEPVMLLLAAGETTVDITMKLQMSRLFKEVKLPECIDLLNENLISTLKLMCRSVIRKHLLEMNRHLNLFVRVPKLGLPSALAAYLLFNESLDIPEPFYT